MFKQGRTPVVKTSIDCLSDLVSCLLMAGYKQHEGSWKRGSETITLAKSFKAGGEARQIHVQVVTEGDTAEVYAHTEPDVSEPIFHTIAGLLDMANFPAGSRMLMRDLRANGWRPKRQKGKRQKGERR